MATLLLLGVVGDEQRQLPLLASSPLPRHAFLWSRVVIVGWPFAMTLLLAAIAGGLAGGIDWLAVLGFATAAVPVALVLLGSTLALGTWPAFVRVHEATPLAGNLRSVVPILLLALVAGLALWLHYMAREQLLGPASELAPFVLAGAWLAGGVAFAVGCRLAQHNLERLLGPR